MITTKTQLTLEEFLALTETDLNYDDIMSDGILTLSLEIRQKAEGRRQKGRRKVARHRGIMTVWADMI